MTETVNFINSPGLEKFSGLIVSTFASSLSAISSRTVNLSLSEMVKCDADTLFAAYENETLVVSKEDNGDYETGLLFRTRDITKLADFMLAGDGESKDEIDDDTKDATKVDRSAAYGARWVAKNIVAAGLAKRCEVQLAYAIGVSEPVSIMVNTFYTGIIPDSEIEKIVSKVFDLTPKGLISALDLRKPIFQKTASYGHFGRGEFAWEDTNKVADIKDLAGKLGS